MTNDHVTKSNMQFLVNYNDFQILPVLVIGKLPAQALCGNLH